MLINAGAGTFCASLFICADNRGRGVCSHKLLGYVEITEAALFVEIKKIFFELI